MPERDRSGVHASASPHRAGNRDAAAAKVRALRAAGKMKPHAVDPTTSDAGYSLDELEFLMAMDDYKNGANRPFPTWTEALAVLRTLGYRKVPATDAD